MLNLENQRFVIMGVANKRSIGYGVAQVLDEAGAEVIFTYRKDRSKDALVKLLPDFKNNSQAKLIQCDVEDDAAVVKAFEEIGQSGQINGLYHSIAFADAEDLRGRFSDTSREGFLKAHSISSYSLVIAAREASKIMADNGSIVTTTYLGGEIAVQNYNVMGAAKASLESSVRYLALDLGAQGIRVNAISAGPIRTLSAKGVGGLNTILHEVEERAPLKRNVDIKDVGRTAAYLLTDLSSGVTGENIHVDAGYHIVR
ncbi:enoyl-[acyl-carrier-protein] reductase FabI [Macrococcus hajekii]|uniref:Enoyl-[acyl-carrier-protein] reductase [NADH] n=1 Tax=Macrococcus hajekii TaxID=198482 RepID=A0A4V3BEN3_9STAP|nr:enoyl-ACP reductase FabI [Macrococcus hajekii]TDM03405.1 enoyl-[acyl-carrier-protein] reductase FabI [Macrococcus hajekii]GGA98609.1 enoyl-[acyl-carrier-protein] reductase [NADPH] FabI [Macrococcus hajekii]